MELALFVYVVSVLAKIGGLLKLIICVLGVYCGVKTVIALFDCSEYEKKYRPDVYEKNAEILKFKWLKLPATVMICLGILSSLIPSERTMYTALAAYAAQSVVESSNADKVVTLINSKLDEYIKDVETSVKEKSK